MLNKEALRKQVIRAEANRALAYRQDDGSYEALIDVSYHESMCLWLTETYNTGSFPVTGYFSDYVVEEVADRLVTYLSENDRHINPIT